MLLGVKEKAAPVHAQESQAEAVSIWFYLICGFGVILFSNSLNALLLSGQADLEAGSLPLQLLRFSMYSLFIGLCAGMVLIQKPVLSAMGPILIVLLVFAALSLLWSISPKNTFIRTYGLVGSSLMGVFMASVFTWRHFLRLSLYSYLIILALTFVVCLVIPSIGVHSGDVHDGSWRGAFGQKNVMGRMMVIGFILLFFCRRIFTGREKTFATLGMVGCLLLVFLSTSITAAVTLFVLVLLSLFLPFLLKNQVIFFSSLIGILSILAVVFGFFGAQIFEIFYGATGKDMTLTGRTDIWATAVRFWMDHNPLLGYGYGGFWATDVGSRAAYWGMYDYVPPHAHNGLLQLGTELGLIGVSLIVAFLLGVLRMCWRYACDNKDNISSLPLIFFVALVLLNISEVNLLVQKNLIWILFVYSAVRLRIDLKGIKPAENNVRQLERL